MMKRKLLSVLVGQAFGAAAMSAVMLPAYAQEAQSAGASAAATAPTAGVERITITGSSIKRIASEGALPVQTVSHDEIMRSGAQSVTELIQNLSSMQGFVSSSKAVGGSGASISTASIHGVGDSRTLVLLNGRRVATWAGQSLTGYGAAFDLNSLPMAVIDRVEILTDGASALYGSDAVAGVVNFILRSDQTDADVSVSYSVPKGGVGKNKSVSVSKGWGSLAEDGYNLLLSVSQEKQDRMKATDRDFTKNAVIPFTHNGQNYVLFGGSVRSAPANWEVADSTFTHDEMGNPYLTANGTCPPQHVLRGGLCRFAYGTTVEILPESERQNVLAMFTKNLGNHTFSTEFAYSKFELTARIAPAPVDMLIPQTSPLYTQYMSGAGRLDPTAPDGGGGLDLYGYWRAVDAGPRTTRDTTEAYHLAFALKGSLGAWDYNTSFVHSTNKWHEDYAGGWLMQNELDAALANGTFDPFLGAGQQSATGNATISGMQYFGTLKSAESTLDTVELHGSRELFNIGDQVVQLGAGVDVRREQVTYSPSAIARGVGNNIAGDSSQEAPYDVSRNAYGVFGELMVPLMKNLEVTGALRHDHYGDFGNAETYKLSTRYQPVKSFLVRGSLGTGFRAPTVPQVSAGRQLYGVTAGQYNQTGCNAVLPALQAVDPTVQCRNDGSQYEQFASGNKDLQPEKSNQWSLGMHFEPVEWASFGADLWNVEVRDRIDQLDESVVMSNPAAYAKNFTIFNDPGTGNHYVALYLPNENLGEEKFQGIDTVGRVQFQTPLGRLRTTLNWTHMLKHDYQLLKDGAWYSDLNKYHSGGVTFRDIVKLAFNLDYGPFAHTFTTNWKSSYRDFECTAADCGLVRIVNADGSVGGTRDMVDHKVDAYYTFDWQTRYQYGKSLTLTGGVLNLTDRKPPFTIQQDGGHQVGYDNRYADPRGRVIYGTLSYKF